jgi:hypothetical protein
VTDIFKELDQLCDDAEWAEVHALVVWAARDIERIATKPIKQLTLNAQSQTLGADAVADGLDEIDDALTAWVADYVDSGLTRPGTQIRNAVRDSARWLRASTPDGQPIA